MDFMEQISDLRAQKGQLLDKATGLAKDGKIDEVDAVTTEMEGINAKIQSLEKLAAASNQNADPIYDGILHDGNGNAPKAKEKPDAVKPFASLGEQLKSIYAFRKNHVEDKRLQQVNNAVLGVSEGSGADGGFALQEDFTGMECGLHWLKRLRNATRIPNGAVSAAPGRDREDGGGEPRGERRVRP